LICAEIRIELCLDHQRHIFRCNHVVSVRREVVLACWLGYNLPNSVNRCIHLVHFHVQGIRQEVVELIENVLNWNMSWCGVFDHQINLLKRVWLVQSNAAPVFGKVSLGHFDALYELVDEYGKT
jgi:hypothetical protein